MSIIQENDSMFDGLKPAKENTEAQEGGTEIEGVGITERLTRPIQRQPCWF